MSSSQELPVYYKNFISISGTYLPPTMTTSILVCECVCVRVCVCVCTCMHLCGVYIIVPNLTCTAKDPLGFENYSKFYIVDG